MDRYIKVSDILDYLEVKIAKLQNEICNIEPDVPMHTQVYHLDMFRQKSRVLSEVIDYIKQED